MCGYELLDLVLGARNTLESGNIEKRIAFVRKRQVVAADDDAIKWRDYVGFRFTKRVADNGKSLSFADTSPKSYLAAHDPARGRTHPPG